MIIIQRQLLSSLVAIAFVVACGGKSMKVPSAGGSSGAGGRAGGQAGNGSGPAEAECQRAQDCAEGDACVFGSCIADAKECRPSRATCKSAAPTCPKGETGYLEDGCWAGCTPLSACGYLEGCELCLANDQLCLEWEDEAEPVYHCTDRKPDCEPPACSCLGPTICGSLSCVDVKDSIVTCLPLAPPDGSGGTGGNDEGNGGSSAFGNSSAGLTGNPGSHGSAGGSSEPRDQPLPEIVKKPEEGSYLNGRGANCGSCGWDKCDPEVVLCLSSQECSQWNGCLIFCAGYQGAELDKCQLGCFGGDTAMRDQALAGLACLGSECCSQCGAPCP